jgi:glycosyltransferase involved in cell wall biosynthesis
VAEVQLDPAGEAPAPRVAHEATGATVTGTPTLSVLVPTYRRPVLVQSALNSIIQSVPPSETDVEIVVSDNSPEVSEAACRSVLEAWGGRFRYVANARNIGLTGNLNQCVEKASGRYLIFVCDDDRLLPGGVPKIRAALDANGDSRQVLLFGVRAEDESGRVLRRQEFDRDTWLEPIQAVRRLTTDNGFAWFPGVVVQREAYASTGPFDAKVGNAADLDMWVRLFARFGARCIPETVSTYSVHPESASQSTAIDEVALDRLMAVFDQARRTGLLSPGEVRRNEARYLHEYILGAAYSHLRSENYREARKVMALFGRPAIRALGPSIRWLPLRLVFAMLVRGPAVLVRPIVRLVDRLDLVRRVRAVRSRGRDGRAAEAAT